MKRRLDDEIIRTMAEVLKVLADVAATNEFLLDSSEADGSVIIDDITKKLKELTDGR